MHARGLRPRRARSMLAISHSSVLPSAHWNSVGALISDHFHSSITLPACSPVNASRAALRLPAHDSRPGWLATPYLYDSCIRDFTPVYPGALQSWSKPSNKQRERPTPCESAFLFTESLQCAAELYFLSRSRSRLGINVPSGAEARKRNSTR